ncbi:MAG TPA: hypothetical protein VF723_09375 [Pyrinomonadaceae bacterium]
MKKKQPKLSSTYMLAAAALALSLALACVGAARRPVLAGPLPQESFPARPADQTLVYIADEKNTLAALPFETGTTPLRVEEAARSDRRSYVELKGEHAATVFPGDAPRFYLFVPDEANAHPPFLVRLTRRRGARRVTAMAQRGLRGFAVASEEIVMPHYRVLGREGGMAYMEIRAREPLLPGEYAIIGTNLQRIATFRIAAASNP